MTAAREAAIAHARHSVQALGWDEREACVVALRGHPCGLSVDQLKALAFGGVTFRGWGRVERVQVEVHVEVEQ